LRLTLLQKKKCICTMCFGRHGSLRFVRKEERRRGARVRGFMPLYTAPAPARSSSYLTTTLWNASGTKEQHVEVIFPFCFAEPMVLFQSTKIF
jgi:hypothetical protein